MKISLVIYLNIEVTHTEVYGNRSEIGSVKEKENKCPYRHSRIYCRHFTHEIALSLVQRTLKRITTDTTAILQRLFYENLQNTYIIV